MSRDHFAFNMNLISFLPNTDKYHALRPYTYLRCLHTLIYMLHLVAISYGVLMIWKTTKAMEERLHTRLVLLSTPTRTRKQPQHPPKKTTHPPSTKRCLT